MSEYIYLADNQYKGKLAKEIIHCYGSYKYLNTTIIVAQTHTLEYLKYYRSMQ